MSKVWLITGSSRGLGRELARVVLDAGHRLVATARKVEDLRDLAARYEGTVRPVALDVTDPAAARVAVAVATSAFGRLDVVVNNVGGAVPRPFLDTTTEALEEAFRFNVSTAHALITSAIPLMLENGGGSVINISSVLALISGRGFLSYGTAKGALARYTELAAQDLAPRIRVNAIAAGTIATAATEVITADAGLRARVEAATPLRRLGTVDDVAAAVLYLASPASAYLTGTVLEVHGGLQAPNTQQPLPDL